MGISPGREFIVAAFAGQERPRAANAGPVERAAVRVLADPSSAGATYLDLRVPERVAAGGLGPVEQEPQPPVPANPEAPVESGATLNP